MGQLETVQRLGTRLAGGLAVCLLLLPVPALAYTISSWSFTNTGSAFLSDSSADHKSLSFNGSSGGSNFNEKGKSNVTAGAGESLRAHLDMTGLNMIAGTLTVTITLGNGQTQSMTFSTSNPVFDFGPLALTSGTDTLNVTFQFSSNARFTYSASTAVNLQFY